jgi:rhodanese-related sulfurtransferase
MKFTTKLVALFTTLCAVVGCTKSGKVRSMDAKEAYGMMKNSLGVLVDVREEDELKESGIAEGALWIPTSKVEQDSPEWQAFKKALPKDKTIMIYCKAGGRAGRIAEFLAQEGYNTTNVGGFRDWKAANLPIKKFP